MSWFTQAFHWLLPKVDDALHNKDFQQAGINLFIQLADKIKAALATGDTAQIAKVADTMALKAPELVGVMAANTPAAKLVDAENMPPGSGGK